MSTLSIQTIPSTLTHIKQLLVAKQLRLAKSDALPKGFPVMIKGNAVWVGPDFANKDTYIYYLSDPEICEICQSLDAFKGKKTTLLLTLALLFEIALVYFLVLSLILRVTATPAS